MPINNMLRKGLVFGIIILFVGASVIPIIGGDILDYNAISDSNVIKNTYEKTTILEEPPEIEWIKTYGGGNWDYGRCFDQTSDDGYIITGETKSFGLGDSDVYLIKTDNNGDEQWNKTFGNTNHQNGWSVQQTSDGGYIILADYSGIDFLLIKTDVDGNEEWSRIIGGGSYDKCGQSVLQLSDGGYILIGTTESYGSGGKDIWLIKTDDQGYIQWDKTYGDINDEHGFRVQKTNDGGYIILGSTTPDSGGTDMLLIKTDSSGNEVWNKTYEPIGSSIYQTSDGGYVIAGHIGSPLDVWLLKTDENGDELWSTTFGGSNYDSGNFVRQTNDGGYIISGSTASYGAGDYDAWIIKTDINGNEKWNKIIGGDKADYGVCIRQTQDGGYVFTGHTRTYGDGYYTDVWLVKLEGGNQPEGLVDYWSFDEGSGNTAYDSAGDNDGTIYGASWTTNTPSGSDYALDFDGTGDRVVANPIYLDEHTINLWFYVHEFVNDDTDNVLIENSHGTLKIADYGIYINFKNDKNYLNYVLRYSASDAYAFNNENESLALNTWYMATASYDGSTARLYLSGSLIAEGSFPYNITQWGDYLGIADDDPGDSKSGNPISGRSDDPPFNGIIDEVCIYNRALDEDEIEYLYNNPGGESQPPTADFEIHRTNNPGTIRFTGDNPGSFNTILKWDFNGDGTWDRTGSFSEVGNVTYEYSTSGIYNAKLYVENQYGSGACTKKFAVLTNYDISCSNDRFFLSYPTTQWTPPIKNQYTFTCPAGILDHVIFKLDEHAQVDYNPSSSGGNDIWEAVLNMNEGDHNSKVQVLGYDDENYLVWEDEVDTFILITPLWFDAFLLASDISVHNSDDYDYWNITIVPPNVGLGYQMDNVPIEHIGGKYGVEASVTGPQNFNIESSQELTVSYPLCSLDIHLGEKDVDLGSYQNAKMYIGVDFSVSADVQIDPREVALIGSLTLRGEAGVSFDIPVFGIPFLAEVGLTGGVDAEFGTIFVIARFGDDGFTFCPDELSEVFFGIEGHAGLYAQVLFGLGRLEGGLYAGGKLSMKLPSLQKHMRIYGGVYAKACLWIWCAEWSAGIEFEASDAKSGPMRMRTTDVISRAGKNVDLLCLKQYDRESLSNDSSILLSSNVVGNADPKIVLTNEGKGLAVWTDITTIDDTSFQSDIWWSEYNGTDWGIPQSMNTSSSCELDPFLVVVEDENGNQSVVMTYLMIDDIVDLDSSIETFYENIAINTATWTSNGGWSFSGYNISVSSGTVNTMELCDSGNGTVYMTFLVDSNVHPWENGNGSIFLVKGVANSSMVEWEDPVLVKYLGPSLNLSCQPSVSFPYHDVGGVVYTWWNETNEMNEIVLMATSTGVNNSSFDEIIIRETNLNIEYVSSSIVNRNISVSWVENRSSIYFCEVIVNNSTDPDNWTVGDVVEVYDGLSVSFIKPIYSENKSFYLFQAGEEFIPYVIEQLSNSTWGSIRQISLGGPYSLGQLDGDTIINQSQIIYMRDTPVEDWQVGYWKFNEGEGNTALDNSDYGNDGEIIGLTSENSSVFWVKHNGEEGNLSREYGYGLRFVNETGYVLVPYNTSLDTRDEITVCSWIKLNEFSTGEPLLEKNGSWSVLENDGSLELKLWRENETVVLSDIADLHLNTWTFIAVVYDHGRVNVSVYPSGYDNVSVEYQLGDMAVNNTNSSLIVGGFSGIIDEVRLFNRAVTGNVIDSIWFAPHVRLGSMHDVVVQHLPSFAMFEFGAADKDDDNNITTEDVVEFIGHPSGFDFEWDFGDGITAQGEVVTHQYGTSGSYAVVCNATDPSTGVVTPYVQTLYVSDATTPVFDGLESAVAGDCSVNLSWSNAIDTSSFVLYHVYMRKEGDSFDFSSPQGITHNTSIVMSDLTAGIPYYFVVRAKDTAGNMDGNTVEKVATPFDSSPPVFDGLELACNISNVPGSVFLEWRAAADQSPPVTYNVYVSNVSGGQNFGSPFNVTNMTWYEIKGLENQLYYFVVRAEDAWDNEDNNTVEMSVRPLIDVVVPEIKDVQAIPYASVSGGWVNISCNVTDNARIDVVMVNITLPSSSYVNQSMAHIPYTDTYYYNTTYLALGTYYYFIWANDTSGNANVSANYTFEIINTPPNTPSQPSGTTSGYICISYEYSTSTTDPDNDNVSYGWDWTGDLVVDEWTDWYSSGDTCTMSHSWDDPGTYDVRVKAKDIYDAESGWSDLLSVIMENHPPNTPSNPDPEDGVTDVNIDADLNWTGGDPDSCDMVTYNVYFEANDSTPDELVSENQTGTAYDPGTMNPNTQYYWQIVAWDNHGASATGPIWNFTTESITVTILPTSYDIIRGKHISGGLSDLFYSDDSYLEIQMGFTLTSNEPPVWLVVTGTAPTASPIELRFILESHVNVLGSITQKIKLYNYDTQEYEEVDTRMATTTDSIVEVIVTTNPSRFIHPSTQEMKAQLTYIQTGPVGSAPWSVLFDQTIWTIMY